jgi:predicted transcriptional regulator
MEMICDILRVVNDGWAIPTQITHRANMTWPHLMIHLEVLLRNQLLTREATEMRSTYRLTARGAAVLNMMSG